MNAKAEAKRAREQERYNRKKAEKNRQTRNSVKLAENKIRPRDITYEEYKKHRAEQRRKQRQNLSSQKKTALRLKAKEKRRAAHEEKERQLAATTPAPGNSGNTSNMRQAVYNLNHSYRKKAKQLGMSSLEYARNTLNLLNPITPEKRVAIMEQQKLHPCKSLFQEEQDHEEQFNVESELGIELQDAVEFGPSREENISEPLHENMKLFYQRDDISRMLPHSRYSTKHGPARMMLTTIKEAHGTFCKENVGSSIGLTSFQSLRPKNIRLIGSVPLESCLCTYCTNVRLKISTINKLLGGSGQLPPEKDMLNFLTCPHEGRWPKIDCIDGKCSVCSNRMRPFDIFCRDIYSTQFVKWDRWERNGTGKLEPVRKEGSMRELLKELAKDILEPTKGTSFLQHLFTAYWQYSQFKICRTNPEEGELIMVQHFGENRKAAYSSEIKSAHFGKQQITVHPVVCYYRAGDSIRRQSVIFLTDDIVHDHHAVQEFTHKTLQIMRQKMSVKKITIWSDGAASQYKGRGSFHDLTLLPHAPQRCYYRSEHGKGEADGETGIMSQALRRATYQGHNFRDAKDMVEYLSRHYGTDERQYVLIDNISRTDLSSDIQTIPGTRKYHQFQALASFVIQARRLACFCTACREGKPDRCLNLDVVGPYVVHKCKPSIETVLNEAFIEAPNPSETEPSTNSVSETRCPKVGDYIKLTCRINKAQKNFLCCDKNKNIFSVRYLQKSGSKYTFGENKDEGLIMEGPPDYYSWEILQPSQWMMDHRDHYSFFI